MAIRTIQLSIIALWSFSWFVSTAHTADNKTIIVQSTTSTQNSGLFDFILPQFKKQTGITVNIVAVGTGQALKNGKNGDGDVLLVHAKSAEDNFIAEGDGVKRHDIMYNDFIIVGPSNDPAKLAAFINWLTGSKGQAAIASYKLKGKQLFFPNAEAISHYWKRLSLNRAAPNKDTKPYEQKNQRRLL